MPSVLVVEDDADMRGLLAVTLEMEGASVITASNGVEAYDLAKTHHPCLIVLDLMMPVMSGEEFRQAQLANGEIRNIPVLVVSAHYDARRIAQRMNAEACLSKPVDLDTVVEFVRQKCK